MANEETMVTTEVTAEPKAYLVKREDGFHVIDEDGTEGPVCKYCDEGDKTIVLTPNASNRKWFRRAKAEAALAESDMIPLYYKESRHFDTSGGNRLPNAKLIAYLSEEERAEYAAIIERAREAMAAAKAAAKPVSKRGKKPEDMTAEELEAAIAALMARKAEIEGGNN